MVFIMRSLATRELHILLSSWQCSNLRSLFQSYARILYWHCGDSGVNEQSARSSPLQPIVSGVHTYRERAKYEREREAGDRIPGCNFCPIRRGRRGTFGSEREKARTLRAPNFSPWFLRTSPVYNADQLFSPLPRFSFPQKMGCPVPLSQCGIL